jgi:hypothetical protein
MRRRGRRLVLVTALRDDEDGLQRITLSDGTVLTGLGAVVLPQGHLRSATTEPETTLRDFAERHGLHYVAPANPTRSSRCGAWDSTSSTTWRC